MMRAFKMVELEFVYLAARIKPVMKAIGDVVTAITPKNTPHDPRIRKNKRSW